jgi:uncharacterized membrane protein YfcA
MDFKTFEWPPSLMEVSGFVLLFMIVALANLGGLGGGGLLIPYLMIFFQLSLKECLPLGNLLGLLASLTRFIVNFK